MNIAFLDLGSWTKVHWSSPVYCLILTCALFFRILENPIEVFVYFIAFRYFVYHFSKLVNHEIVQGCQLLYYSLFKSCYAVPFHVGQFCPKIWFSHTATSMIWYVKCFCLMLSWKCFPICKLHLFGIFYFLFCVFLLKMFPILSNSLPSVLRFLSSFCVCVFNLFYYFKISALFSLGRSSFAWFQCWFCFTSCILRYFLEFSADSLSWTCQLPY